MEKKEYQAPKMEVVEYAHQACLMNSSGFEGAFVDVPEVTNQNV
jgi:hypothetical protein